MSKNYGLTDSLINAVRAVTNPTPVTHEEVVTEAYKVSDHEELVKMHAKAFKEHIITLSSVSRRKSLQVLLSSSITKDLLLIIVMRALSRYMPNHSLFLEV